MPRAVAQPIPLRQAKYRVVLPPLHEGQTEVIQSPARFKVCCCGRQWGKTVLGACMCVTTAARGGDVWWVAPSFPVGELGWQILTRLTQQIPGTKFHDRPIYRITLPTGGTIQLRSADNPDSLRGASLDGVVLDEAATAKEEAWPVLRPTLSVRQGWALFISTPKGQNWFYDLFQEAEKRRGWARWVFPSISSPYLDKDDIEQAREEMSSLMFSQEYEAEFISAGAGMFKQAWFRYWHRGDTDGKELYILGDRAIEADECKRFSTADLAWTVGERADYTVIATWAVTPNKELILVDAVRGKLEGPDIVPTMQAIFQTHRPAYFALEKVTRSTSIVKEAERAGLPVREVRPEKNKIMRAMLATARMERGTVWFPIKSQASWVDQLETELLVFPGGAHDDFVDNLAYACLEIARPSSKLVRM